MVQPQPVVIGPEQVLELISVVDAADAIEADLRRFDPDNDAPRWSVDLQGGQLLVMPCERPDFGGTKLATVAAPSGNGAPRIGGVYLLWKTADLDSVALIDGGSLTTVRTAALSLVATRLLAPGGARRAIVFGTGPQAWSHVLAISELPSIEWVGVVGRQRGSAMALVHQATELGLAVEEVDADAVSCADVVCTATSSSKAVFDGTRLRPAAHVNAVGSHTPDRRELDKTTMSAAAVVAVDTPSAWESAGELQESHVGQVRLSLRDLLLGDLGASFREARSVFKSVGAAYADLAVGSAVYRRLMFEAPGEVTSNRSVGG